MLFSQSLKSIFACNSRSITTFKHFPIKLAGISRQLTRRLSTTSSCSSHSPLVVVEKRDNITLIGINRPEKRNCVNIETGRELKKAFDQFEADDEAKVAILHGKGGCFCAGFDLAQLASAQGKQIEFFRGPMVSQAERDFIKINWHFNNLMCLNQGISQMMTTKPTIASIDGYAVAGELECTEECLN